MIVLALEEAEEASPLVVALVVAVVHLGQHAACHPSIVADGQQRDGVSVAEERIFRTIEQADYIAVERRRPGACRRVHLLAWEANPGRQLTR